MSNLGAETTSASLRLGDFIQERRAELLEAWERRVRVYTVARHLSGPVLRDHVPQLLDRLARVIQGVHTGAVETLGELPDLHALERLVAGYDLHTAARELGDLRDTILEFWEREAAGAITIREVRRLDQAIDEILAISVDRFARARERTLRALDRVSSVSWQAGDLAAFLHQLMAVVLETVAAVDAVSLQLKDEADVLHVRAAIGLGEERALGFSQRVGEGFAGRVARLREPMLVRDATNDPLVINPHIREQGIRALYGVPLVHQDEVIGVAQMGSRSAFEFSDDDQQLFRTMAQRATALIVQAQLTERLRSSEARLQAIIDHAPAAIFVKDPEGRIRLANQEMLAIFGRSREELLGKTNHELVSPDIADVLRANDLEVLRSGQSLTVEEVFPREDGPHTYLSVKFPLPDENGEPHALCGISTDITERRRTEEALRATSQRLKAILDAAVDSIITIDDQGTILDVNPATTRLFGYAPEELTGRNISMLMPEPDRSSHDTYMRNYLRTGVRKVIGIGREVLGQRKDGTVFPIELSIGEMVLPGGRFFTGMMKDISRRKTAQHAQAMLVEAGTLLAQSLDLASTLRSLAHLTVTHLSDYCTVDLLGDDGQLHRQVVLARDPALQPVADRLMAFPPRVGSSSPMARVLETGRPQATEVGAEWLEAVALNAEHRAVLEQLGARTAVIVPLVARGRKLGVLNMTTCEAGRMPLSAMLEMARGMADRAAIAIDNARLLREAQEAVRVREDVVAIVSHDLRNPLNAISLASLAMLRHEPLTEAQNRSLRRIISAADRAHRMIRDLLDFTQARAGGAIPIHPRPVDLHELTRQVVDEVHLANPGRDISVEARGDGHGEFDEDRLAQVITNLVGNALQHSPAGTPVRVSSRAEGDGVTLVVHNQGPPIPAELRPVIFEPYRRGPAAALGRGSIGLGLYITRQIVLGHGGHIDVRSTEKDGTHFTVWLPRTPARVVQ
ncbi:PAS domain S-box protein [Pyxidicoccus fallax]|nr:PAS domain S-box protein [Pyxidicoccus fallax]NPC77713.1 PAS domain S-box protein [Pyxidicoccus fallax]